MENSKDELSELRIRHSVIDLLARVCTRDTYYDICFV